MKLFAKIDDGWLPILGKRAILAVQLGSEYDSEYCFFTVFYSKEYFVGNKEKGWISKRVSQENKARQIFRKKNFSYRLIHTPTCAYRRVRNVCFSDNLVRFALLPHYRQLIVKDFSKCQRYFRFVFSYNQIRYQ